MAKENSFKLKAKIPGFVEAEYKQTVSSTNKIFRYTCAVDFASRDAAKEFRDLVEKSVSEKTGEIHTTNIETIEITK